MRIGDGSCPSSCCTFPDPSQLRGYEEVERNLARVLSDGPDSLLPHPWLGILQRHSEELGMLRRAYFGERQVRQPDACALVGRGEDTFEVGAMRGVRTLEKRGLAHRGRIHELDKIGRAHV